MQVDLGGVGCDKCEVIAVVGVTVLVLIAAAVGSAMSVGPGVRQGSGCRRLVALIWMDSFDVGGHGVSVERVLVVKLGVFDHGVRDGVFVLADELTSMARARLFVGHGSHLFAAVGAFERDVDEMDRSSQQFVVVVVGVRGVFECYAVEEGEEHAGERVRADRGIDASCGEILREERREHGLIDAVSLGKSMLR
jgi:hypothetical protein